MRRLVGVIAASQFALVTSAGIAQSPREPAATPFLFGRPLAEWVREAAADTSIRIRVRATLALSRSGALGRDAAALLRPRLVQAQGDSRQWVLWSLEALQDRAEAAVPDVMRILDDTAASIRSRRVSSLDGSSPIRGLPLTWGA